MEAAKEKQKPSKSAEPKDQENQKGESSSGSGTAKRKLDLDNIPARSAVKSKPQKINLHHLKEIYGDLEEFSSIIDESHPEIKEFLKKRNLVDELKDSKKDFE